MIPLAVVPVRVVMHRCRRRAPRTGGVLRTSGALLALAATACTYGPPRRTQNVASVAGDSLREQVAIVQQYHLHRPPTGLAAFPDGGVPRTIEHGAEVLVCERRTGRLRLLARLVAPPELRSEYGVGAVGWLGDTLVLRVHGSTGVETGRGEIRITYVGVLPDGRVVASREVTADATGARASAGGCRAAVDSLLEAAIRVSAPPA